MQNLRSRLDGFNPPPAYIIYMYLRKPAFYQLNVVLKISLLSAYINIKSSVQRKYSYIYLDIALGIFDNF